MTTVDRIDRLPSDLNWRLINETNVILFLAFIVNAVLIFVGYTRFGIKEPCREKQSVSLQQDVKKPLGKGEDRPLTPSSEFLVPNIVHYIWYNNQSVPIKFHHMLSVLSAHKILRPDVIYLHTNNEPNGPYWERIRNLSNFKINKREPPTTLFGEKVKTPIFDTDHSDIDRVKVLMEYGGIYLDFDVLITSSFDDLRRYPCAMGLEDETRACGGVIVCSKYSPFLMLWINSYLDDYRIDTWAYNSGLVPFNLARRFPNLIHMDKDRINRPNYVEIDKIWGLKKIAWKNNYAIHLWHRIWKMDKRYYRGVEPNDENIKTWNGTFGEVARSILYGEENTSTV